MNMEYRQDMNRYKRVGYVISHLDLHGRPKDATFVMELELRLTDLERSLVEAHKFMGSLSGVKHPSEGTISKAMTRIEQALAIMPKSELLRPVVGPRHIPIRRYRLAPGERQNEMHELVVDPDMGSTSIWKRIAKFWGKK